MRRRGKDWLKRLLCITLSLLMLDIGIPQYTALAAEDYQVTTIAGISSPGSGGDGGPANLAGLNMPYGVAFDNQGNLYIADTGNNKVRKITADGKITTVAGNGNGGYSGDGGSAIQAELNFPTGVAIDSKGNLYIADNKNFVIRKVTADGVISTIAGIRGSYGHSGDGGPAVNSLLVQPFGVALDSQDNLYISDMGDQVIRKITTDGVISTVAGQPGITGYSGDGGPATSAKFNTPNGIAVDSQNNIYIADERNNVVRKVTADGVISTVAGQAGISGYGGDEGPATSALLSGPMGVALDGNGNLYIIEYFNNVLRKVGTDGIISTVVGNFPVLNADFYYPSGIAVNSKGEMYVADYAHSKIKKIAIATYTADLSQNGEYIFSKLLEGYTNGDRESKAISVTNTGTGTLTNLKVTLSGSGADSFDLGFLTRTTLNNITKTANFTIQAKEGLAPGTYTATVTVSADKMQNISFTAKQVVEKIADAETPQITRQPQDAAAEAGKGAEFEVAATVERGTVSYQWYKNTKNSNTGGTIISGAVQNIYTAPSDAPEDTWYYCVVTNTDTEATGNKTASVTSDAAKAVTQPLTNAETPRIINQPEDVTVHVGAETVLEVAVADVAKGTLSYQWYKNTADSNTGGTLIAGANQLSYAAPAEQEGTSWYYCIVTNTDASANGNKTASVTSRAAKVEANTLTNADTPQLLKQPQDVTVQKGEEAVLKVTATVSGGSLTYQWFRNTADSTAGGTPIAGAVQDSYSAQTDTEGKVWYYCKVTNTDTSVNGNKTVTITTRAAAVTVNSKETPVVYTVTVINGSGGGTYTENASVSITASPAPSGKVFLRWTAAGNVIFQNPGAASTVFKMPAENVTVTAEYQNAGTNTPSTPTTPGGNTGSTEEKTIEVVEAPKGIPNTSLISVEEVGKAFDKSVEVRLKEDSAAEKEVRHSLETDTIGLNTETLRIFPLDISLYIKGTNTKVQPAEGTSVKITCPVPTNLLSEKEKLLVVTVTDGRLKILPAELTVKEGVSCIQFTAVHFSPYAFVVDSDGRLAEGAQLTTDITVTEGTLTNVTPKNLPAEATVKYHVSTPTHISIDSKGNLFAKKAGSATYMAAVTYGGKTKVYAVKVKVKKAKGGTPIGFIRYYGDIFEYQNINYRITAKAAGRAAGEVAVANNQINTKLPAKVVIPETITWKGKKYKVTSIDESAFYNKKTLTSVTLPANMKTISATAFTSCHLLKEFKVASGNKQYSAKNGMLLNKQGTGLLAYPSASGTVVIDKKITFIGDYAFSVCKQLKAVVIPATVKSIGGCAFAHSSALEKVVFQGAKVPEMVFYSVFEKVKDSCIFQVPAASGQLYVQAMQDAWLPKGIIVKGQ